MRNKYATDPATLSSFIDVEDDALPLIDRSTLEAYSICPAQARLVATGRCNSHSTEASSGSEAHDALGQALAEYVNSRGALNAGELAQEARQYAAGSRPDVQPDVIRALRPALWNWARMLSAIHHENILRFDGGTGDRSGQLSWDLPGLCRVTAEVDLLYAGPSKECLHEIDYKTGHKHWTAGDVADAFQFQLHAWLVLNNYPEIEALETRVWNTRSNALTWSVEFQRRNLPQLAARIRTAAGHWLANKDTEPEKAPTWPDVDKCGMCDAAASCPAAGQELIDLASNPAGFLGQMVAVSQRLDSMKRLASAWVDRTGEDIAGEAGLHFGTGKPKANRKPTKSLYTVGTEADETNGD